MSFDILNSVDKRIHFIGIGGISMSGLAEILIYRGYKVSGSDWNKSHLTEKLKAMGAEIYYGHKAENVKNAGLIIYTAAVSQDNPELVYGRENGIKTIDRAEFLGELMKGHKYNVAISGTHGKTTTTSMLSMIVLEAEKDPTILVGGELDAIGGNVRASNSEYFITEACEYKASFLKFFPYIGVILNIEEDHLDFYKDINDIENTFMKFSRLIPDDGYLIGSFEDKRFMKIYNTAKCKRMSFGITGGDLKAEDIIYDDKGCASFNVLLRGNFIFKVKLNVPGEHNIKNALAAVGASLALNIDNKSIIKGLEKFVGTHRRFEIKGVKNGVTVVDDYAHHPTEIKAALKAAKNYPHKKIVAVFQPHTYSRTKTLFKEFLEAFYDADQLILADIYAAREIDKGEISSVDLGDGLRAKGVKCVNLHSFEAIVNYAEKVLEAGDILITIGAGDVYQAGEMYLND